MKRLSLSLCALAVAAIACLHCIAVPAEESRTVERQIKVGKSKREYRLHVPPNAATPAPLVIVFHGGGTASQIERFTRFSELSDHAGFIVVYPQGIGKNWNDGRDIAKSKAHRDRVDDIGFIAAMLDEIGAAHPLDPKRIYAAGISNGAIFSHYLAANLSDRIAAIAPVVGGIADSFYKQFKPTDPVSVFILQGAADPLVPYAGGNIVAWGKRGKIVSTAQTVNLWTAHDQCAHEPQVASLPDKSGDGCRVKTSTWSKCRAGTEVTLYTFEGGGHTWPGGTQYLPESMVGKVCRDVDATDAIWEFFQAHPKQ